MIKEYNNIVKNKHKTKEVLLQAIKEVVNDNDYQDKLNDLNNQKLTIEQRLSKIIDMELDNTDIDRKELFIKKEKELINELSDIKNKIRYYEDLIDTIEYDYPTFHLSMDCFWAEIISGDLVLKEHAAAKWLTKTELDSVEWLPADITLIDKIRVSM